MTFGIRIGADEFGGEDELLDAVAGVVKAVEWITTHSKLWGTSARRGVKTEAVLTYISAAYRAATRVNASGELVGHAFFGEPHRCATGIGTEQDAVIPLPHVLGEGQRHLVESLDRWLSVGCKKKNRTKLRR